MSAGSTLDLGAFRFRVASRTDNALLCEIFRETSMGGSVQLALARDPDAFASQFGLCNAHAFIIAEQRASGRTAGVCERAVHSCFVDGEARKLPYLAGLRVLPEFRHRLPVLKGGFAAVRKFLAQPDELPFALTSIGSENKLAERILCAGLPGFPTYQPVGQISTFTLKTRKAPRSAEISVAAEADLAEIAAFLQDRYRKIPFAPVWTLAKLYHLHERGLLRAEDFLIRRTASRISACLAVWDQTACKQTLVKGYGRLISTLRPLANLLSIVTGAPSLPPANSHLRHAFLSHVGVESDDAAAFRLLLEAGRDLAHERGFGLAVSGFATGHPFADLLRRRRAFEYRSNLYLVHWEDGRDAARAVSHAVPHPEIALL